MGKAEETKKSSAKGTWPEETHDFMSYGMWVFLATGYAENRGIVYVMYIVFIFLFYFFVIAESITAMILYSGKKELVVDSIHTLMLTVFALGGLTIRWAFTKSLHSARDTVHSGFYCYEDEEHDEEERRIIGSTVSKARHGILRYRQFMLIGVTFNMLVFSCIQWMSVTKEEYEELADLCNPYIPHCMHLPFSTRSPTGFITAFLINVAFVFYIYATAIAMQQIYIGSNVHLSVQTALLNHSICTIPRRAKYLLVRSGHSLPPAGTSLYDLPEYQRCLYRCLRSNIQHHQVLKRFNKETHPFNGSCLLILMIVASLIFGSRLYLILKGPPIRMIITFAITMFSEQGYPLFVCYYGQVVLEESNRLFKSLYEMPWYLCNKSFNKALCIFMMHTRIPMRVRMVLFEATASVETYGDVWVAIYKVSNLIKQSDSKLIS